MSWNEMVDELTNIEIIHLKSNRDALKWCAPWAVSAFREMPRLDRVFLNGDEKWICDGNAQVFGGWTYRLREDWERPEKKSELGVELERWERVLSANNCPLDLIECEIQRELMEKALKAGLCERYVFGQWEGNCRNSNCSIRLASDWRERMNGGGG